MKWVSVAIFSFLFVIALSFPAESFISLPEYKITQKICNTTGTNATDVHLNLVYPGWGLTVDNTSAGGVPGTSFDIDINVAAGGSVDISWKTKIRRNELDPVDPGYWTFGGANIGSISVKNPVVFDYTYYEDTNTVDIYAINAYDFILTAIDIDIAGNIPPVFFSTSSLHGYDSDLAFSSGSSILSDFSGDLHPGYNLLVSGYSIPSEYGYFAARIFYSDPEFPDCYPCYYATGVIQQTPEPASLFLLGIGAAAAIAGCRRKVKTCAS